MSPLADDDVIRRFFAMVFAQSTVIEVLLGLELMGKSEEERKLINEILTDVKRGHTIGEGKPPLSDTLAEWYADVVIQSDSYRKIMVSRAEAISRAQPMPPYDPNEF